MRKSTIRRYPPTTRKFAKLVNETKSLARRLTNLIKEIDILERDTIAWQKRQEYYKQKGEVDPLGDWKQDSILAKVTKNR